ncbi:NAD-dependent epimerase/dehydratase family protein [Actinoplanes sp. NPDC049316]|uniref:NAD-dependent epimerase/dehydratase family protein n=1 Tax=Actinoplanes sp. NPDC049316 TaxID=3154727 RepID=UPI00341DEFE8
MTRLVIHGAAGFVGSTLLTGGDLGVSALTLVDPAPLDADVAEVVAGLDATVRRDTALPEGEADVLLVLAGQTDVDQALADPRLAFTANGSIALEVAEWWRQRPDTRVVYLSSDEVLGVSDRPLAPDAPYRPTQPYAASKAAAEMMLRCYADTYGLDLIVIRSCNLVGGRQRARKLIPTAVTALAAGEPVPVFGDGTQAREYLAVEDLCEVLRSAIAGDVPVGVHHCTSGAALTILEVVELVAAAVGVPAVISHVRDRLVHDRAYAMDPGSLTTLGWKPHVTPADAISRAAADMVAALRRGEPLTYRTV